MSDNPNAPLGAPWSGQQTVAPAPVPASDPEPVSPPRRPWRGLALAAGLVVLLALAGFTVTHYATQPDPRPKPPAEPFDISGVYAKVRPGVAVIDTVLGLGAGVASGTGIVLSPDGVVLTNNHVVEGTVAIRAVLAGGRVHDATVLGYDRTHDLAVIKLADASGLATATLGDSGQTGPGDPVLGVGNAGGTGGEPSSAPGKVTALGRSIVAYDESTGAGETLHGLIQTDADVRSGDSGGPLADTAGRVIGVNTAAGTGYELEGSDRPHESFAIPITPAAAIAQQIVAGKASETVHIGPSAFVGLTVNDGGNGSGAMIASLVAGGPAAKAGLKADLLVVAVDDQPIGSAAELVAVLDRHHPGDRLKITVSGQGGAQASVTVTASDGPAG
ncbi:S1C family serine protease [Amycolatopsis jiangsuensis]|uniref:S1-C subfamily serine protease n=1 Tax=Amycolatopsis jiangsuensis TaxID=1181879 RepID=A0A840J5T3_9PSEU|nr:S1C family serine protease [Amycolatopsis jiangsuensis]MBB4688975.1 S1-C subfamily serine protease [Amycolatopsis jiangsuensis]